MEWTYKRPTQDGYYWLLKYHSDAPTVVYVYDIGEPTQVSFVGSDWVKDLDNKNFNKARWYGPIPKPTLP